MVHNDKVTSQSSVIFARFQTSEPLAIAKLAKVQNHVHDLAFSQQVSARILGAGDYANLYQKEMGVKDAAGFDISASETKIVVGALAAENFKMVAGTTSDENNAATNQGQRASTKNPEQPNWARSSADLSGGYQGRHTLRMADFLNVFYPAGDAAGQLPQGSLEKLRKAKYQ